MQFQKPVNDAEAQDLEDISKLTAKGMSKREAEILNRLRPQALEAYALPLRLYVRASMLLPRPSQTGQVHADTLPLLYSYVKDLASHCEWAKYDVKAGRKSLERAR